VVEADAPVLRPNGRPHLTLAFVPRRDVTPIDTWTTTGLCGTGSHDYAIEDVFMPQERTFWFSEEPHEPGPLYVLPWAAAYSTAIAAVPVGIAEHTLELYAQLAPQKKSTRSSLTLQEKANVHDRVGVALATVEAATAYLERIVMDAWAVVAASGRLDWTQRGKLRLGSTHAAHLALQAIEHLYTIAGATAVYTANEFDRCLRGARTAVQHVAMQFVHYEIAGKQFVGLDIRDSNWAVDDRGDAG